MRNVGGHGNTLPAVYSFDTVSLETKCTPNPAGRSRPAEWRRRGALNPAGRLANWLLYVTVGYGYGSWLAGAWLAGPLGIGTLVFARAYPAHMTATGTRPPAFHPFGYTLDVLLPIIDLDQQRAWQPQGAATCWSWALIAAGWVLTTAVVAGLTGILKRD